MKRWVILGMLVGLTLILTWIQSMQPVQGQDSDEILQLWQGSVHALSDVNCSSCHQDQETQAFVAEPTFNTCQTCHEVETDTFLLGKHGIRLLEGQSPLTPAHARLPMKAAAHTMTMTCATCHDPHSVNTQVAATDSCLACHNDTHSLNYYESPHGQSYLEQVNLPRPSAEVVSCATCHLPRQVEGRGEQTTTMVNHNNTYTLKPRDRMVKEVCMNCHGMEFSYNSIFDDELVETNFSHAPELDLETLQMARVKKADRESRSRPS